MSGVQGQGSPSQITNINAPQPIPKAPEMSSASMEAAFNDSEHDADLELAFAQAQPVAAPEAHDPELESAFAQASGQAPAVEEKSFAQKVFDQGSKTENALLTFPFKVMQKVSDVTAGAAEQIAGTINGDEKADIGKGIVKAFTNPEKIPPLGESIEKAIPLTKSMIKAPVTNAQDYAEARAGNENYEAVLDSKAVDTIPASQALAFYADLEAGNLAIKGISKAAAGVKLIGKALTPALDALKASKVSKLDDAVNATESLSKSVGNIEEIAKKFDVELTPVMKDPANPRAVEIAKAVKKNKVYQDIEEEIGNQGVSAIKNMGKTFGVTEDAATTDEVLSVLKGAKRGSGKKIEVLKDKMIKAYGNGKIPAPEFQKAVENAMDALTTNVEENRLYISDPKKEEELTNYLQELNEKIFNSQGRMTAGQWENEYRALAKKTNQAFNRDTTPVFNNLKQALGKDQNGMMAVGLEGVDDTAAKMFKEGKLEYSTVMNSYDKLGTMLSKNELVADSMLKRLFFSEARSADDAKAVFDVLQIENPKMVQDLRGKAWNYLANDARITKTPEFPFELDMKKFAKSIRDMAGSDPKSTNLLEIMAGSKEGAKSMVELADVLESIQNGYMGRGEKTINELQFGRMLYHAGEAKMLGPKALLTPIIDSWKENKRLKEAFENMDVKKIIQAFPPAKRAEAEKLIRKVLK